MNWYLHVFLSPNHLRSKSLYIRVKHMRIPVSKLLPLKMAFLVVDVTTQFTKWFKLVILIYRVNRKSDDIFTKKAFCQSYLLFYIH